MRVIDCFPSITTNTESMTSWNPEVNVKGYVVRQVPSLLSSLVRCLRVCGFEWSTSESALDASNAEGPGGIFEMFVKR